MVIDLTEQQAIVKIATEGLSISGNGISVARPGNTVAGTFELPDTSANAIGSGALVDGITVKADEDNAGDVYLGGSGVTVGDGMRLSPGESVPLATDDIGNVFVIGATNDKVHYIGG